MLAGAQTMPVTPNQNSPIMLVQAQESDLDDLVVIRKVGALKDSASNHFYIRHGFLFIESSEFDNYYVRRSIPAIGPAC
jgi:hypothetical protein